MKDHISICICTLNRNHLLERLLRKINVQETAGLFDFSVVVVDNDPGGVARDTVIRLREELGIDIEYDIEPEQTIPAARNHTLRLARGNYIAIIDDDEFPPQNWLITLYRALQEFNADGGLGPVLPFFDQEPPAWLLRGRFCERPHYPTGRVLNWSQTRTGNVLLKKSVFDEHGLRFEMKWKTSGSDQAFFKQAMQVGYTFIAVEEAPVYEVVPPKRWEKSYYLRRALVHGYNAYRYHKGELRGVTRISKPVKSAAAVLAYGLALPFCACLGTHAVVKCLEGGGYHLSWLLSMLGIELLKKRDF